MVEPVELGKFILVADDLLNKYNLRWNDTDLLIKGRLYHTLTVYERLCAYAWKKERTMIKPFYSYHFFNRIRTYDDFINQTEEYLLPKNKYGPDQNYEEIVESQYRAFLRDKENTPIYDSDKFKKILDIYDTLENSNICNKNYFSRYQSN